MNSATQGLIELHNVSKSFYSATERIQLFDALDLTIVEGTTISITGDSGCGKSTLLNIIAGLETPSGGTIRAGCYSVHDLDERMASAYRSEFLGLVFQFHYLLKDFTALENVMLPAWMTGIKKKEAQSRAEKLLADVGLEHRMHHYPSQMSGGERQRAAVARALVNEPSLVLADEPTGNLDPGNAALIRDLLFSVVKKYGKTLILVTHDREMAMLADTAYRLQEGTLRVL